MRRVSPSTRRSFVFLGERALAITDVFLDFETRSVVDIRSAGGEKYTRNIDRLLCMAYRIGVDGETQLWKHGDPPPQDLFDVIEAGNCRLNAFNATFEEAVWRNHCVPVLGWIPVPSNIWHCSAARSRALALPGSLGMTGEALRCDVTKDKEGRAVMLQVSKTRKPSQDNPSIWFEDDERMQKLYSYCISDVDSEISIWKKTRPLIGRERDVWLLDQEINRRGVKIDRDLAFYAIRTWKDHEGELNRELADLTMGVVTRSNQRQRIEMWLKRIFDIEVESLDKEHLPKLLERTDLPPEARRVLEIRQDLAVSSIAKFTAMEKAMCEDDRVRGVQLYCGASQTGRWAGRLIQTQNITRGVISYKSDEDYWHRVEDYIAKIKDCKFEIHEDQAGSTTGDILSSLIRPAICADTGKKLIVCDYSKVELCGNGWVADQENLLEQRRNNEDPYKHMAAAIYRMDVKDVVKGSDEYQLGKAASLGCGYGMGADKFFATCQKWGMPVDRDMAKLAVDTFRSTYDRIRTNWYETEDAAKAAIREPGTEVACPNGKISYVVDGQWLFCVLPSGRRLAYMNPRIEDRETAWGEQRPTIVFDGYEMGKWRERTTYSGKLVENYIQALCRDLLAESMLLLDLLGVDIIFHVHDEAVVEVPDNDRWTVPKIEKVMSILPDWAEGFPLAAEGFEAYRYKK